MLKLAVVGLGKMGLSHLAIINAHPGVRVAAVCDPASYVLDVLNKYTGVTTFTDFDDMMRRTELDAVLVATPSSMHAKMVRKALEAGKHVFCEKPLTLDPRESEELSRLAAERGLVNQVGYHYRFVGTFQEVKRLLDAKVIGDVTHIQAEAYGPVVLKPKGGTWRSQRAAGGGCLYDYAAHPLNLVQWYFGMPRGVGGTVLGSVFSSETDDEVFTTLYFDGGRSAQLSVNWSDESCRKMSTKITVWGTAGRITADRQEVHAYFRDTAKLLPGYREGWNTRNITQLTEDVWFYVRGEEYSAQLDYFVRCIEENESDNVNSFATAAATDRVIAMMVADAQRGAGITEQSELPAPVRKRRGLMALFGK
ncbi:MAG TPA: Gfo/Idh/MocA family oxidoreductase [Pirellulales bacterium]|nr:Gfo/Idh/MocA family oxidoreductase [Pirellulales bacterium]